MYYLLALLLAKAVIAEDQNDTIIHGWVAEPDGRGTWSILWSCLATIFICTWSVLHLDIPKKHNFWFLFGRKVRWVLVAVFAPEFILVKAIENYLTAWALSKDLVRYIGSEWTFTHAQFACAKGFYPESFCEDTSQRQEREPYESEIFKALAKSGRLTAPPISEDELKSRGKTDGIVKLIAILQIIWFGLQILVRVIQHLHITALEILTVAFIFCSILTYGFCWNQPQGIEYPVSITIRIAQSVNSSITAKPLSKSPLISRTTRDHFGGIHEWALFLLVIFASAFGAIHCLAWNLPFPTPAERLAWRICSVATTSLPIVIGLSIYYEDAMGLIKDLCLWLETLGFMLYIIGRIIIIVLAFIALREAPADTYQTTNWNNYLPHFAV